MAGTGGSLADDADGRTMSAAVAGRQKICESAGIMLNTGPISWLHVCDERRSTMEHDVENTTKRDWHTLKSGDVVWFANGWYEVFDAYAVGRDIVKVKLIVDGHVESYNVQTQCKATCRA